MWLDFLQELLDEALGCFLMVDANSSSILHSAYSCILVGINGSKGLVAKTKFMNPNGY